MDYKWLYVKDWLNDNKQTGETPVLRDGYN